MTRFNIRDVCPSFRCEGKLVEVDLDQEFADHHYRNIYLNMSPEHLVAHEHTAQLATEYAAEVQTRFIHGRINILSCSTTFELGVDVGELETVFMKNMPPTPANYVQRAGRAGRRTSSTAYALTYARLASHDFSNFQEPEKMIRELCDHLILMRLMRKLPGGMCTPVPSPCFGAETKITLAKWRTFSAAMAQRGYANS